MSFHHMPSYHALGSLEVNYQDIIDSLSKEKIGHKKLRFVYSKQTKGGDF
jgi:hypothetical protein